MSDENLKLICWNMNSFTRDRNDAKVALLAEIEWDYALLQEVSSQTFSDVRQGLGVDGVSALDHFRRSTHRVPIAAAMLSRREQLRSPEVLLELPRPERFLSATVTVGTRAVKLASWHAPNAASNGVETKMSAYCCVRDWIRRQEGPVILSADTNSWDAGFTTTEPATGDEFGLEHEFVADPSSHGLRDAYLMWLEANPDARARLKRLRPAGGALATTYVRGHRNHPVVDRFDRVWLPSNWQVTSVRHEYADAVAAGSDHAFLLLTASPSASLDLGERNRSEGGPAWRRR